MNKKNFYISVLVILLIIILPFVYQQNWEFAGVDAQIEGLVSGINPLYQPWIETLTPELSGEMETFLFSAQAAMGAGIVAYILGYFRGIKVGSKK